MNRFKNGRFTPVTIKDGLFDDFVSRILEDDRGNFWMLGNRGTFSVKRADAGSHETRLHGEPTNVKSTTESQVATNFLVEVAVVRSHGSLLGVDSPGL